MNALPAAFDRAHDGDNATVGTYLLTLERPGGRLEELIWNSGSMRLREGDLLTLGGEPWRVVAVVDRQVDTPDGGGPLQQLHCVAA